jgi:Icc-related predicted phosphoesterase
MTGISITAVSDLHGFLPQLEGGDLLIIAGDLTARDDDAGYLKFYSWLHKQNYKRFIVIAGNHDNLIQKGETFIDSLDQTSYLCDSGTEFEGLKIWGSPWTKSFPGMNPKAKAFTVDTERELAEKWALIPADMDILVTHSPPWGVLDRCDFSEGEFSAFHAGSIALADSVLRMKPPLKLWVWGHIHESYGRDGVIRGMNCIMVNASHVNERYEPVNKPIRIIL